MKYLILHKKSIQFAKIIGWDDLEMFEQGLIRIVNIDDQTELTDAGSLFSPMIWTACPVWAGIKKCSKENSKKGIEP